MTLVRTRKRWQALSRVRVQFVVSYYAIPTDIFPTLNRVSYNVLLVWDGIERGLVIQVDL